MNIDYNQQPTQVRSNRAIGRIHRLEPKLGETGPFGHNLKVDPITLDCARMKGHSSLFSVPDDFKHDLEVAIEKIMELSARINESAAFGDKKRVTLQLAINAFNQCFRYLQEADILAEVLTIKSPERRILFGKTKNDEVPKHSFYGVLAVSIDDLVSMSANQLSDVYEVSELAGRVARENQQKIHELRRLRNLDARATQNIKIKPL